MHKGLSAVFSLLLLGWTFAPDPSSAANWPRFRGPNGTGISTDKDIPVEFGENKNLIWKSAIPGSGRSSPVVWGDRIFLISSSKDAKDRSLLCLDTAKGDILWGKSITGSSPSKLHKRNTPASSTPATDGERVYVSFWDGEKVFLYAYDFKGNEVWKQDLGAFSSEHGHGNSPLVYKGKVIYSHDQDGASQILAFNATDGKPLWKKDRAAHRTCYSTPFLYEKDGAPPQLIVATTTGIDSYNPDNGERNWNWPWKFDGEKLRTVGGAIAGNGMVVISSGNGGGKRYTVAVTLDKKPAMVWDSKKDFPYVPSMLVKGDHVYSMSDKGFAGCFSLKDGNEVYHERLAGAAFSASPVMIDGKIYAPSEEGNVYVLEANPQFKLLAKNTLGKDEVFFASPAVADNRLYIRGKEHLYCIGKK